MVNVAEGLEPPGDDRVVGPAATPEMNAPAGGPQGGAAAAGLPCDLPPFFYFLPGPVRDLVLSLLDRRTYDFGEVIIAEGGPPDALYVLVDGSARVVKQAGGNQETALATLGPGDLFGETGVLNDEPRNATVRARTPVEVARLDANVLRAVVEQYPEVHRALLSQVKANSLNRFVRIQSVFAGLSNEAMARLVDAMEIRNIQPGEVAVREGIRPTRFSWSGTGASRSGPRSTASARFCATCAPATCSARLHSLRGSGGAPR